MNFLIMKIFLKYYLFILVNNLFEAKLLPENYSGKDQFGIFFSITCLFNC